jgi:hypothetical protein
VQNVVDIDKDSRKKSGIGLAKLRFLAYFLPVLFRISSPASIPLMEA